MSIWTKIVTGCAILVLLAAGLAFWMDLYGVRRGCFAPGPDQAAYESARDLYGRAGSAISARNYIAANDMLDLALLRLGNAYQLGRGEDETSETVLAANAAVRQSEFQIAAQMKQGALEHRLYLFQRKTRLSDLCRSIARRWRLD